MVHRASSLVMLALRPSRLPVTVLKWVTMALRVLAAMAGARAPRLPGASLLRPKTSTAASPAIRARCPARTKAATCRSGTAVGSRMPAASWLRRPLMVIRAMRSAIVSTWATRTAIALPRPSRLLSAASAHPCDVMRCRCWSSRCVSAAGASSTPRQGLLSQLKGLKAFNVDVSSPPPFFFSWF